MDVVDVRDSDDPHQESYRWNAIHQSAKELQPGLFMDADGAEDQRTAPRVQDTTGRGNVREGEDIVVEFVDNLPLDELYGKAVG